MDGIRRFLGETAIGVTKPDAPGISRWSGAHLRAATTGQGLRISRGRGNLLKSPIVEAMEPKRMRSRLSSAGWSNADRDRWSLRAALSVFALLALLLVWLLARMFWLIVPGDDGTEGVPLRAAAVAASAPTLSISKWHLFGDAPGTAATRRDAPATTLSLTLRGTLADADPHSGLAVIANDQGVERAWRVGEEITPGVTLDEVHADRVLLLHDGAQEILNLPRDEPSQAVAPIPPGLRGGASPRNTAPASPANGIASFEPPNLAHGAVDWQQTMARIGSNPAEVAKNVRIDPVISNGQISGVRVSAANGDAAMLGKFGLRPSDIVTAVNGVPVDSVQRGQQILESLRDANAVRVTVTRDGSPTEITVKLH